MSYPKCDNMTGEPTCPGTATYIDEKGWVYCTPCGQRRRDSGWKRARKLEPIEHRALKAGLLLPCYDRDQSVRTLRLDTRIPLRMSDIRPDLEYTAARSGAQGDTDGR